MTLSNGERLSFYEILGPLGAGGMGEVYRANDSRLDREVAIKVLPEHLADDPERLRRFEREAKTLAALNHPNVAAIFGVDHQDAIQYLVLELVPGEDLATHLCRGPMVVADALDVCRQIADGLETAHEAGVVHRDLKPANVRVTPDGSVKILDFGLAKPMVAAADGSAEADSFEILMSAESPSLVKTKSGQVLPVLKTDDGTVLGTPPYMSPEQARGKPVDRRTDIWAFGCVLYECLTAKRAFRGSSLAEVCAEILEREPDWEALPQAVPPRVHELLRRCLHKDPRQRLRDIGEARVLLSQPSSPLDAVDSDVRLVARSLRRPVMFAALGLLVGFLVGRFGIGADPQENPPPALLQPVKTLPLTFSGRDTNPATSPNGETVAFASRRAGTAGIWIKQLRGGGAAPLTEGSDDFPRFSPDGTTLLFTRTLPSETSLYRVPLVGGGPRKLIDDAVEGDWSPDGARIAFTRWSTSTPAALAIANADGSSVRILTEADGRYFTSPRWSPDGRTIAYLDRPVNNNIPVHVTLLDLETSLLRKLLPPRPAITGLTWSSSGQELLFGWSEDLLSGRASTAVRVSLQNVHTGVTRDLFWTSGLLGGSGIATRCEIAGPGQVVLGALELRQGLVEIPLEGSNAGTVRTLTSGNSVDRQPTVASDGETVLFSSNRGGHLDLWTINRRTGAVQQLTDDKALDWDPAFSPDGTEIAWSSDRSGNLEIWTAKADGSGARQVTRDGVNAENPSITPDGETIIYMTANPQHPGLWRIRRDGTDATQLWSGVAFVPELSPDGRYAVFTQGDAGANKVITIDVESGRVLPFELDLPLLGVEVGEIGRARWYPDGSSIAFLAVAGRRVGVVSQAFDPERDTRATRRELAGFNSEWHTESFDLSPDGRSIILSRVWPGGTVMLIDNVPFVR